MTHAHFHSKFREAATAPSSEKPVYKMDFVQALNYDAFMASALTGLPVMTRYTIEEDEEIKIEYLVGEMVEVK